MIFISVGWSPNMTIIKNGVMTFDEISHEKFEELSKKAYSCIRQKNIAKILGLDFNPAHVPYHADVIPDDVVLEYYCYKIFDLSKVELKLVEA